MVEAPTADATPTPAVVATAEPPVVSAPAAQATVTAEAPAATAPVADAAPQLPVVDSTAAALTMPDATATANPPATDTGIAKATLTQAADVTATTDSSPKPPPVVTITVQPGFTLWYIAKQNFGDGVLYVQVFDANKDKIKNPDLIYPGQVFTMPGNYKPGSKGVGN